MPKGKEKEKRSSKASSRHHGESSTRRRRDDGSPHSDGSNDSGQSQSSSSSLGLRQLFDQLPPNPPTTNQVAAVPPIAAGTSSSGRDPEALRALPQRDPWYSPLTESWHYARDGRLFTAAAATASRAAHWVAEHNTQIAESLAGGVGSLMQGAGIAAADPAAPANTAPQAAYGAGVSLAGAVSTFRAVTELGKIGWNYAHPDAPNKYQINYPRLGADLVTATSTVAYGAFSSGAEQHPQAARAGMSSTAILAGVSSMAAPFAGGDRGRQTAPAAPAPAAPYLNQNFTDPSLTSLTNQLDSMQLQSYPSTTTTATTTSAAAPTPSYYYPTQSTSAGYYSSAQGQGAASGTSWGQNPGQPAPTATQRSTSSNYSVSYSNYGAHTATYANYGAQGSRSRSASPSSR